MYHIIVNPASRSGKGMKIWKEQIEPALRQGNVSYRPYFSGKAGDVARIAGEIVSAAEAPVSLIILGGDGTVNEALQGIPDPSRVTIGYIPTGSSNDLARDLKIPTVPAAALDLILNSGTRRAMDLGSVAYPDGEIRRFAVSCGIGFDAAVCEEALRSKIKKVLNKLGLGKLTYLGIALKQLFATKAVSARLILDDQPPVDIGSILFTACMIHRFEGGGFMFCPDADDSDGILDLCAAGDLSKLLVLFALPTAFQGKHYRFQGITPYRARKVTIETASPLWVQTDGEVTRRSDRITVTCGQNAFYMITP
ncbi:MAG: diacylglycerol kinase family lipid kinase [Roseburia sp.]|nr:diacylglycerol kinase family lipid kinase [Roseburia sp.]MCM1097026.1 diacylglycerol kinase family lipid kinase [Ruminococcus flavefaciens]